MEIVRIKEEVKKLVAIFEATQNSNNSDRTITVEPETLQSITSELVRVTEKNNTAILPNDLEDTINSVRAIIRYCLITVIWLYSYAVIKRPYGLWTHNQVFNVFI